MKHLLLSALVASFAAFGTLAAEDKPACDKAACTYTGTAAAKDCTKKEGCAAEACDTDKAVTVAVAAEEKAPACATACATAYATADKKADMKVIAQVETEKKAEPVAK